MGWLFHEEEQIWAWVTQEPRKPNITSAIFIRLLPNNEYEELFDNADGVTLTRIVGTRDYLSPFLRQSPCST